MPSRSLAFGRLYRRHQCVERRRLSVPSSEGGILQGSNPNLFPAFRAVSLPSTANRGPLAFSPRVISYVERNSGGDSIAGRSLAVAARSVTAGGDSIIGRSPSSPSPFSRERAKGSERQLPRPSQWERAGVRAPHMFEIGRRASAPVLASVDSIVEHPNLPRPSQWERAGVRAIVEHPNLPRPSQWEREIGVRVRVQAEAQASSFSTVFIPSAKGGRSVSR